MNAPTPNTIRISPENEENWLKLREPNLNSTDIASLFGCSPYQTAFELWHIKKGNVAKEFKENERMTWGKRLEYPVAYGIAEDNGWTVELLKDYVCMPGARLGSSFDFIINFADRTQALLEIKTVDYFAYKDGWIVDGDSVEAPPHIELQVQHQMLVSGLRKAYIGVLIGGNRVAVLEREADDKIHRLIESKARAFWRSIEDNIPPEPDYAVDASTIIAMNSNVREGAFLDASDDANIAQAIADYHHISAEVSAMEKVKDAKKAALMEVIGDYEKVAAGKFTVSAGMVKETAGTLITEDMVGTYIGGRKEYRMCRVSVKK